jgi:hypothetical protein
MILLYVAAAAMAVTAFVHSYFGERRLIGPLVALDAGLLASPRVKGMIRFSWHFTSALKLLCALVVAWPGTPRTPIAVIGMVWLLVGLYSLVKSQGRHVGWPPLLIAGGCAIAGAAR